MNTTAERLQRKLSIRLREKNHMVQTVVPDGWEPYDMMQLLKWEDGEDVILPVGVHVIEFQHDNP